MSEGAEMASLPRAFPGLAGRVLVPVNGQLEKPEEDRARRDALRHLRAWRSPSAFTLKATLTSSIKNEDQKHSSHVCYGEELLGAAGTSRRLNPTLGSSLFSE